MVWNKKIEFLWAICVVITVVGVSSTNVIDLSTNQKPSNGSSAELTKNEKVLFGKLVESNATCNCGQNSNGCSFLNGEKTCSCLQDYIEFNGTCKKICSESAVYDVCKNGGKCKNNVCQCLSGTIGDRCEIIHGCENLAEMMYKCGYRFDVECAFNQTSGTSYCRCKKSDYVFDEYDKRCKKCDCGKHGTCYMHGDWKRCDCYKGYATYINVDCEPCDCGMYSTGCSFKITHEKACSCENGYVQIGDECSECSCGSNGVCAMDEWGHVICKCFHGYAEKDGHCVPCDCGTWSKCELNDLGEKICICKEGYGEKDGVCTECSCYWNSGRVSCTFHNGEEKCLCPEGYEEKTQYSCTDINECEDKTICPFNTECRNTPGSYECTCKKGYRPYDDMEENRNGCTDIDECKELNECPYRDTTVCINTQGSYYCECKYGYYTKFSSKSIEYEGCQEDQREWRTGYIVLILAFFIIAIGLIIAITKRK